MLVGVGGDASPRSIYFSAHIGGRNQWSGIAVSRLAREACGIAGAAGAIELSLLRIGTKRPAEGHAVLALVIQIFCRADLVRRLSVLDPRFQRALHVENIGTFPTPAMLHARDEKEPVMIRALVRRC
jgi:hypothetical protein